MITENKFKQASQTLTIDQSKLKKEFSQFLLIAVSVIVIGLLLHAVIGGSKYLFSPTKENLEILLPTGMNLLKFCGGFLFVSICVYLCGKEYNSLFVNKNF